MRTIASLGVLVVLGLGGCALERAQIAQDARAQMVGMSKEQVLACMGPPANKLAEGATEVWAYNSGNGMTIGSSSANIITSSFITADSVETRRFCTVNIVMQDGRVSRLNYTGPTGGLLTAGEQCAFAVQNCVRGGEAAL